MANSRQSAALITLLWIGAFLPAHANNATSVVRDLGTVARADDNERLAQSLFALVRANPDDRLVAVEARVKSADDDSLTYARYLYDREKRHLLVLRRTARAKDGNFYHYSSYTDTSPEDFQRRLPVRGQRGFPSVSQSSNKAEVVIPVSYPEMPRLSDWP